MTAKTDLPEVPAALADAALIDGPTCAAAGSVSVSWWLEAVRAGRAPQPVVRQSRFTRWNASAVRAFWLNLAAQGTADDLLTRRATTASMKAQATRRARAAERKQPAQVGA